MTRCLRSGGLLAAALAAAACNLDNPGLRPPLDEIHFPTSLALTETADGTPLLAVLNANIDASYNAGTLQLWDREAVEQGLAACRRPVVDPSVTCPLELQPTPELLVDAVRVPSYARELALGPDGRRFYLAVEGREGDLTHVDFEPSGTLAQPGGFLDCGEGADRFCASRFRFAAPPANDARDLEIGTAQIALAVGAAPTFGLAGPAESTVILVGERFGTMELFLDRASIDGAPLERPTLVDAVDPVVSLIAALVVERDTGYVWVANPDASRLEIPRVGVAAAAGRDPTLFLAEQAFLSGAGGAGALRDVSFGDGGEVALLSGVDPRLAGRPALLFGRRPEPGSGRVEVRNVIPLCEGTSRLERATLAGRELLFVSCFDARRVDVIDAASQRLVTTLREAGGAFALAVDEAQELLWIGDFDASTVRAADLRPALDCLRSGATGDACEPYVIGFLGLPARTSEL